jgi:molybdopterin adenylyltransferase
MAKVVAVSTSSEKGTYKYPVESVFMKKEHGIEGDAHAGKWHRQVSLLAQESIDKMAALGVENLTPGKFAENITTQGIELHTLPVGTRLLIGEVEVQVTQIGKKCHQHCEIYHQVGMCIMPTEGIFVKVLSEGYIKAGDDIKVVKRPVKAIILVASDKGYAGERQDASGPALKLALEGIMEVEKIHILPDNQQMIADFLRENCDNERADIILTSGGTGFAPTDVTPEATLEVIERAAPGIPEAMRQKSMEYTDRAILSRAIAGIRKKTLIINLPGSPKAAVECLNAVISVLPHAVETLRGDAYECARPD